MTLQSHASLSAGARWLECVQVLVCSSARAVQGCVGLLTAIFRMVSRKRSTARPLCHRPSTHVHCSFAVGFRTRRMQHCRPVLPSAARLAAIKITYGSKTWGAPEGPARDTSGPSGATTPELCREAWRAARTRLPRATDQALSGHASRLAPGSTSPPREARGNPGTRMPTLAHIYK